MRQPARLALAVSLVGLLGVSACSRSGSGATESTTPSSGGGSTSVQSADFGTTKVACGPNNTGETLTATDQGVTADSISLATISDTGFTARPGLNQELYDASDVFAAWCNSLGGINGRKIKIDKRDAALTNYKQQITASCTTDFSLVGGGGVFDNTGQGERLRCLLPNFPGYVVSAEARGSDLTYQAVPNPYDAFNIGAFRYVKNTFPQAGSKVGFISGNVNTLKVINDQYEEIVRRLGMKVVSSQQYAALGEPTWVPFAQALKSKGIRGLVFVGEPANLAKLAQAMQSIDYVPDWVLLSANFYDDQLLDLAAGSLKNIYVQLFTTPFFTKGNAAMDKYLALYKQYLPKGKVHAVLGQNSFASWMLFAQAASECGAKLTRRCATSNVSKIKDFDAGGLQAPTDPADTKPSICYTLVTVKDGKWAQVDVKPNRGVFNCDNANYMKLQGNYGQGVKLSSVGKTMNDLP